jgi:hypothetical protein
MKCRLACSLLVFVLSAVATPLDAQNVFLSSARVVLLRQRVDQKIEPTYTAYLSLKKQADAALAQPSHAVTTWYVPGFYVDPQGHKKARTGLAQDANAAYVMALTFRMSGDRKYATAAVNLINSWVTTLRSLSRKDDSMLSFSYHFPAFIFAAALLEDDPDWPTDRQQAFKDFVRSKALPMNTMDHENNWGNWGLVLVMASATYLQDHALFSQGVERWKHFIDQQIAADGHLPLEVTRNNGVGEHGIWYSHFSLMAQTLAAEIARVNGVDLYDYKSPRGRSLRQAFERMVPWTVDPKTFPYYKGNDVHGQAATGYISYWEILNAHWPQPLATAMLVAKRPLSASHSAPDLTFTHGDLLRD